MSKDKEIAAIVEQAVHDHVFPGAVVGYIDGGRKVLPFGHLTYDASSPAVQTNTLYDIASVTKSVATNSIILRLIEDGLLSLDDKVSTYLPEIASRYRHDILLKHLLTYTVTLALPHGLSDVARQGVTEMEKELFTHELVAPPGERYWYTNPPAVWLGWIAERVTGKSLDVLAQELIFTPLDMQRTTFDARGYPKNEVAPTEIDWRGEVHGAAHDEAAWAFQQEGRVVGCAGVFSVADDLLRYAEMVFNRGTYKHKRVFEEKTLESFYTNQIAYLNEYVGLGWEINQPRFMGSQGSNKMFGKTGFTGCLFLIDLEKERAMVLLCNRTYPKRPTEREPINLVRSKLADVIFG